MSSELRKVAQTSGFDQAVQMTNLAKGRDGFETHTGFTVIGAKVKRAWTSGQRNRESTLEPDYLNPEVTHVPVGDPPWDVGSGTAIIELQNGGGLVLGIIPGYVGTVVIRDSAIAALAYAPSRDTMLYEYYKRDEQAIRERRAFATAAASVAQIQQLAKSEHLTLDVGFDEGFDPILGILAAYAYYLADNTRKIREVFKRMSYTPFIPFPFTSVPFDVAMLAGELVFEKPPGHIASCCPLFSFGWSLLDRLNVALPGRIREAGKHRLPGLWAAFDKEGIGFFQEALDKGEIS
jgi:hypothetical protein